MRKELKDALLKIKDLKELDSTDPNMEWDQKRIWNSKDLEKGDFIKYRYSYGIFQIIDIKYKDGEVYKYLLNDFGNDEEPRWQLWREFIGDESGMDKIIEY